MTKQGSGEVTLILEAWSKGDPEALDRLTPLIYQELHNIAESYLRNERPDHTLQPTAVVHEAFLDLVRVRRISLHDRAHFLTFAARLMRRILIDHARRARAEKRGLKFERVPLNDQLAWLGGSSSDTLDLASALDELEKLDPQKAKIVELKYFLGSSTEETAELLGISKRTVDRNVRFSLAWLYQRLRREALF